MVQLSLHPIEIHCGPFFQVGGGMTLLGMLREDLENVNVGLRHLVVREGRRLGI